MKIFLRNFPKVISGSNPTCALRRSRTLSNFRSSKSRRRLLTVFFLPQFFSGAPWPVAFVAKRPGLHACQEFSRKPSRQASLKHFNSIFLHFSFRFIPLAVFPLPARPNPTYTQ